MSDIAVADIKKQLQPTLHAAANLLRLYSELQVDLWRQVPWYALVVAESDDLNWVLASCFTEGLYPAWYEEGLDVEENIFVDLETGKIMLHPASPLLRDEGGAIRDNDVLRIDPGALDVAALIERLKQQADRSSEDPLTEAQIQLRAERAAKYNLSADQPYVRVNPIYVT